MYRMVICTSKFQPHMVALTFLQIKPQNSVLKFFLSLLCGLLYISSFLSLDAKSKDTFPKTNLPHLTIQYRQAESARIAPQRQGSFDPLPFCLSCKVNPPYYVPLVELVPHPETAPSTVDRTYALMQKIGQSPVRVMKEIDGFALNRLQYAVISEAWRLVEVRGLLPASGSWRGRWQPCPGPRGWWVEKSALIPACSVLGTEGKLFS